MTQCLLFLLLCGTPKAAALDAVYLGTTIAQAQTTAASINRWENSKINGQIWTICLAPGPCSMPKPSYARLPWQQNTPSIVAATAVEIFITNQLPPRPRLAVKLARIGFNIFSISYNLTHRRTVPPAVLTFSF